MKRVTLACGTCGGKQTIQNVSILAAYLHAQQKFGWRANGLEWECEKCALKVEEQFREVREG